MPGEVTRNFNHEEVEKALAVLVRVGGCLAASRVLEEQGMTITRSALRLWSQPGHKYYARFQELQAKHGPEIEQAATNSARSIMAAIAEKEMEGVESIDFNELDQRDRAGALRNLSTSKALQADKILLPLTGRPSQITENRSAEEIIASLERKGIKVDFGPKHVESVAEEIPPTV